MRFWQQGMIYLARNERVKNFMQNRATMSDMAMRFVGGRTVAEVTEKSRSLKPQGYRASLFYLGEYVEDLEIIGQTVLALREIAKSLKTSELDLFICVDPTQIGFQIDSELCRNYAFEIGQQIKQLANTANCSIRHFLMVDMEDSSVTEATLKLYADLCKASLPAAVTLQAYLYRTESDLKAIVSTGGVVRLVKGAFAEGKEIAFTNRSTIDENYLKLAEMMLSKEAQQSGFYPIFATHDDRLINQIIDLAQCRGWAKDMYEFEMLYGVRVDLQEALVKRGEQVRLYLPFGVDWWPYAVRRVGESPKNARFLMRSVLGV